MKKMMAALLAVMMLAMGMTALADEAPQPEGGKKFESSWALMGGLVEIFYEEEGYRVSVDLRNGDHGTLWQYSCHYVEEKDALLSVSSTKWDYTLDGDGTEVPGEIAYQGLDDESTAFTIDEKGFLHWDEARENAGADLEFRDIGRFEGVWRNDAEEVWVEFRWAGLQDEESFFYNVRLHRGSEEVFTEFDMKAVYNPESGKLEALGTAVSYAPDAEGVLKATEDGEEYDAFFSPMPDGRLLFEAANGIELEYDILGLTDNG